MKKIYSIAALTVVIVAIMSFMTHSKSVYTNLLFLEKGVISSIRFNDWIDGAPITADVFVKPDDGPNFVGDNGVSETDFDRQDFFRWSQQMFYWILSPVPNNGSYGTCKGLVMDSPEFFDFKRDYVTGEETYVRHTCNGAASRMSFDVKSVQNGIHNLPLFIEAGTDKVYDVDKTPKSVNGFPLIYDSKNNKVEVSKITLNERTPTFYDKNAQIIDQPHLILSAGLDPQTTVQLITIADVSSAIFMGSDTFSPTVLIPTVNEASINGATNVLMDRPGSLVYYNIMVNDVYVAFSQMVTTHFLPDESLFPTTAAELDGIKAYGAANGIPIIDTGNRVLAMELKTSWVETTNLPHPENYVKKTAVIPNYEQDTINPLIFNRVGTRTTTLALVGMHVVGSVKGHPEMIWSTFEHVNNTPNSAIDNLQTSQTPSTGFIFFDPLITLPSNVPHISGLATLEGINGFSVSPSNTVRNQPFGWAGLNNPPANPNNPVDVLDVFTSNTQLVDIYSDALNRLALNDVRRNYFQVGAMWNSPFNNAPPGNANLTGPNNHIAGTVRLSNSTMETYTQATTKDINTTTGAGLNCFSCHNRGTNDNGEYMEPPAPRIKNLSHVFGKTISF